MGTNSILIDGDYVTFKAAAGKDDYPIEEVIERLDEDMHDILSKCKEVFDGQEIEYVAFLSGKKNKRKETYPDYKSNRKDKALPEHLAACRLQLSAFWNGVTVNGIEADDAVGICAHYLPTETTIIATADKDFAQMKDIWVYDIYPARAEHPRKEGQPFIDKELTEDGVWYRTSVESANKQLAYQLIYGDAGDGVKGLTQYKGKKRGHKKAAFERVCAVGEKSKWNDLEDVIEEVCRIYEEEFEEEEGAVQFTKVHHLVYIQEFYCDEFKEIPRMKKYDR